MTNNMNMLTVMQLTTSNKNANLRDTSRYSEMKKSDFRSELNEVKKDRNNRINNKQNNNSRFDKDDKVSNYKKFNKITYLNKNISQKQIESDESSKELEIFGVEEASLEVEDNNEVLTDQLQELLNMLSAELSMLQTNIPQNDSITGELKEIKQVMDQLQQSLFSTDTTDKQNVKNVLEGFKALFEKLEGMSNASNIIESSDIKNKFTDIISELTKVENSEDKAINNIEAKQILVNSSNQINDNKLKVENDSIYIQVKNEKKSEDKNTDTEKEDLYNQENTKALASTTNTLSNASKANTNSFQDVLAIKVDNQQTINKSENINEAKEIKTSSNVEKTDILKQIVKKAEVGLKDGKSEMNLKLEPENLGKLSLKVTIEKGLVTARFVAENQQVKEVIENNFNQLKDMLQQKGIAVNNFSVSVGQEGREFHSKNNYNLWKESFKNNMKRIGEINYTEFDDFGVEQKNPYTYHDGKVDYRA